MSRRRLAIAAVIAVLVLLFGGRSLALRYTEHLWFTDLGQADRYRWLFLRALAWQVAVFLVTLAWFGAHTLGVYASIGSVHLPQRLGDLEIDEAVPSRTLRAIALGVAAVLAGAMTWTFADLDQYVALARTAAPWGLSDPLLHRDYGFYLARLPLLEVLHLAATVATLLAALLVIGLYALTGSFALSSRRMRITPHARAHLVVLLCALAVVVAWGFYLDAWQMVAGGGHALGALSPADQAVRIPASRALAGIGAAVAIGCALSLRWPRPGLQLWLWAFFGLAALLGRVVIPVMTEAWGATSNTTLAQASARQADDYSRAAFGISDVPTRVIAAGEPSADSTAALADALEGVYAWSGEQGLAGRLLDAQAGDTTRLREWHITPADAFGAGRDIPAVIAVPQTDAIAVLRATPRPRWSQLHRGALAWGGEPVALDATPRGGPLRFLASLNPTDTVPPGTPLRRTSGRVRFLPRPAELAVVAPDESAIGEPVPGVLLSGIVRRVLLAWALQSPPLLDDHTSNTDRVLYWRDLPTRLARLYPFAAFDPARAAMVEGRLVWIADGYLLSSRFPLAESLRWHEESINYIAAPYIVTVDATSGQTRLYLRGAANAFAASVARAAALSPLPAESLPPAVRRVLRYPSGLLGAQATMLARRGVRESSALWAPGWQDTSAASQDAARLPVTLAVATFGERSARLRAMAPIVDQHGAHLVAIATGTVSAAGLNELSLLRIPASTVPTPHAAAARIATAPAMLAVSGLDAAPHRGPVMLLPAAGTIAFVQLLVAGDRPPGSAWQVQGVAVLAGARVGFGPDIRSAVHAMNHGTSGSMIGTLAGPELNEARAAFLALDSARQAGDWERFGRAWATLRRALRAEGSSAAPRP